MLLCQGQSNLITFLYRTRGFQEVNSTIFKENRHNNVVRFSSLRPGRPGTDFSQRLSRPQSHSAAGKIMSMKNSNDTNGYRTRNLPPCTEMRNIIMLALTHFQNSTFLSNHSDYLQKSELKSVSVCLPLKFFQSSNVVTLSFIWNSSKHVERSRVKNSVLSYRLS